MKDLTAVVKRTVLSCVGGKKITYKDLRQSVESNEQKNLARYAEYFAENNDAYNSYLIRSQGEKDNKRLLDYLLSLNLSIVDHDAKIRVATSSNDAGAINALVRSGIPIMENGYNEFAFIRLCGEKKPASTGYFSHLKADTIALTNGKVGCVFTSDSRSSLAIFPMEIRKKILSLALDMPEFFAYRDTVLSEKERKDVGEVTDGWVSYLCAHDRKAHAPLRNLVSDTDAFFASVLDKTNQAVLAK